jgi:hypothetical protein
VSIAVNALCGGRAEEDASTETRFLLLKGTLI